MGTIAGTRPLNGNWNIFLTACSGKSRYIALPMLFVKIGGKKPASFVLEHRVDANGIIPLLPAAVVAAESAAAATALELTKLTQEYTAYRRRAVALMKERDESLRKLSDDLAAARAKAKA